MKGWLRLLSAAIASNFASLELGTNRVELSKGMIPRSWPPPFAFFAAWKSCGCQQFWARALQWGCTWGKIWGLHAGWYVTHPCLLQLPWIQLWEKLCITRGRTSMRSSEGTEPCRQTLSRSGKGHTGNCFCGGKGEVGNCCGGWAWWYHAGKVVITHSWKCSSTESVPFTTQLPGRLTLQNLLRVSWLCLLSPNLTR